MSSRKYRFDHLTAADLEAISAVYPDAVETVRRPSYKILSMLAVCKVQMPGGIQLVPVDKPAFLHNVAGKP